MLLEITELTIEPDIKLVQLSGTLAQGPESQRVETMVEDYASTGVLRLILDMTRVDHIDSAGIGVVALASGKMKEAGGKLAVIASEGRVLQMLTLTQINSIVPVCATLEAATAVV